MLGGVGEAVLYVVLQDDLGRVVERAPDGGELDEHLRAVAPVLDHALDALEVAYRAAQPVHNRARLRVAVAVAVSYFAAVGQDVLVL